MYSIPSSRISLPLNEANKFVSAFLGVVVIGVLASDGTESYDAFIEFYVSDFPKLYEAIVCSVKYLADPKEKFEMILYKRNECICSLKSETKKISIFLDHKSTKLFNLEITENFDQIIEALRISMFFSLGVKENLMPFLDKASDLDTVEFMNLQNSKNLQNFLIECNCCERFPAQVLITYHFENLFIIGKLKSLKNKEAQNLKLKALIGI